MPEVRQMGFWESFIWSVKTNILGMESVTTNPVSGETETVEKMKIPIVTDAIDTVGKAVRGVGNTLKNLPIYLFVAVAFLGVYLVLMGRKGKSVI